MDNAEISRPMYEKRQWGEYTVISLNDHCLVKNLYLMHGKSISYQSHKYRSEIWVITSGEGTFILDGITQNVIAGDVLRINKGQKHKISAITDLYITEVQLGEKFDENDIERFDM